jgi:hypothetical protein
MAKQLKPLFFAPLSLFFQQDSENNTILMLLADQKPSHSNIYEAQDNTGAYLRMARLYYDRYSWILDWSNVHGKTALHIAALKGNEELVRVRLSTSNCGVA